MTDDRRQRIDAALEHWLNRSSDAPPRLREAMHYSLLAPGKRLRPTLVLLAAVACGGDETTALPAGCAVEMIHAYSLIHDDLPAMDDDDLRRGRPTCHKVYGEALAILAGDALQTLAFSTVAEAYPAATAAGMVRELARASGLTGMVGGQVLDLDGEGRADATIHDLERVHALKTGALFRACLRLGLWSAQIEPDFGAAEALDGFGRAFGLAFQITDDLLDVEGDAEQTGKRVGKDAGRGKLTYPGLLGVDESRRRAGQLCESAVVALAPFGAAAEPLANLARRLLGRDR